MSVISNERRTVEQYKAIDELSEELFDAAIRLFFSRDFGGLHVLAQSSDDISKRLAERLDEPVNYTHVAMSKKVISNVYNRMNKEEIVCDDKSYPVYADAAEQIKNAFDAHCSAFAKFVHGMSRWKEETLHSTHMDFNTPLQTKIVSLIAGCTPHELSPGYLNIEDPQNVDVLSNPFAGGLWRTTESNTLRNPVADHYDLFRCNVYEKNKPDCLGVEAAMAFFNKNLESSQLHIEDNYANYAEALSLAIAKAPEPHMHWSAEFKEQLKLIDKAFSIHELLDVIELSPLKQHLFLSKKVFGNDVPDANKMLNVASEAGVFSRRLLQKIDSLCTTTLALNLTYDEKVQVVKVIEEITSHFADAIYHTCSDMVLPSLAKMIPPSVILWVPLPLRTLEHYIIATTLDQKSDGVFCLAAIGSQLTSEPTKSAKCYYSAPVKAKQYLTTCLSVLGFKDFGLLEISSAQALMSTLDELYPGIKEDTYAAVARANAVAAKSKLDSVESAASPEDMSFMRSKPI